MEKNIFAEATRKKVRFTTNVGNISVEDLWDLPLNTTKKDGIDLDSVSQIVLDEQEGSKRKSLINPRSEKNSLIDLKIEILTHIIDVKTQEKEAKELEAVNKEKLEKLKAIREKKQDQSLENLSLEDIDKEIAALKG